MTQPVANGLPSITLLRRIGYSLLLLALFDIINIIVPPHFMNPNWEFKVIGALIERVAVPLLGLGLVLYGEEDFRFNWERLLLKLLSWASLVAGVLFLLLAPLIFVDSSRINDQINYQINTQVSQRLAGFERLEKQLGKATTATDIVNVIANLKIQGLPPNIKNHQEVKSRLLLEATKAKEKIRPQVEAAWADRRLTLLKNSVKWFLGSLVAGVLFSYIWQITRWARRGSRRSK